MIMKKSIVFMAGILFACYPLKAQNPVWALPNNSSGSGYMNFVTGNYEEFPTVDPNTGVAYTDVIGSDAGYNPEHVYHFGAANAISDENGNLLFFIVGRSIFDRDGRTIYSNEFVNDIGSGYSEILVIPNPGNCNQYYIVTERILEPTNIPSLGGATIVAAYAILDLTESPDGSFGYNSNAIGAIITGWTSINSLYGFGNPGIASNTTNLSMAATPPNANNERFLFVIQWIQSPSNPDEDHQYLLICKITDTGIQTMTPAPLHQLMGIGPFGGRQELEVIKVFDTFGNMWYRLASGDAYHLGVCDLNPFSLTVNLSSIEVIQIGEDDPFNTDQGYLAGIEFSRNGQYVFFSHRQNDELNGIIDCYDLVGNSFVDLQWTPSSIEFQYSYLETAPDGNIYAAAPNQLAQITNTSNPAASNLNENYLVFDYPYNTWDFTYSDYSTRRYVLPDQIDQNDYTAQFSESPICCITAKPYDVEAFTANTDFNGSTTQVWTEFSNPLNGGTGGTIYVRDNITIPANFNVTIQDMTIMFHPDARVIVERSDVETLNNGAMLTLKNSTLTADDRCSDVFMWQGIEVRGWNNQSQLPINNSKQGYLLVTSNSVISNARYGAQAQSDDLTQRGGIIRVFDSQFIDNRVDVRIHNYVNFTVSGGYSDNQSFFRDTKFRTTGLLNDPTLSPQTHAFIYQANGVKFQGCDFINENTDIYPPIHAGMGIFAIRSKLTVTPSCGLSVPPCASPNPNTFTNLAFGIYTLSGNSLAALTIDGNNFINNFYGVYVGGIDFATITRNNFEVHRSDDHDLLTNQTTGLYMNGCSGYKIEANTFKDFDDPMVADGNTRGIVINNSGIAHNEVYRNTFDDLLVGGQSQKINSPDHFPPGTPLIAVDGLRWLCNDFGDEIDNDMFVSSGRIAYWQGTNVFPGSPYAAFSGARNIFSHDTPPGDQEIIVNPGVQSFTYAHYDASTSLNTVPIDHSMLVPLVTLGEIPLTMNYTNSCPSKILATGVGVGVLISKKNALALEIEQHEELIDGGDTQGLLDIIENASAGAVKEALLAASPYVSDEVLITYLNSNPPAGHAKEVLLANSPVSDFVIDLFNSMSYPSGTMNQVNAQQSGTSDMEYLQGEIGYLEGEREFYIDEIIRYYLRDTIIEDPIDSIIDVLDDEDRPGRREQLIDALIIDGDLANATFVRSALIAENGESNFTDLAEINIAVMGEEDPIQAIQNDPSMLAVIENIALDNSDPRIIPRGQGLLYEFIYSGAFVHDIEDLIIPGQDPKSAVQVKEDAVVEPGIFVYPNPASGMVYVQLNGFGETDNLILGLYNVVGENVMSIPLTNGLSGIKIDISAIPAGVYFVNVLNGTEQVSVVKLVIEQ
jgi:hypothetical protein